MQRDYKLGMIVGRFQPFHFAHQSIILEALRDCEEIVIVIGSAQEGRTKRNPLYAEERRDMMLSCFRPEHLERMHFVLLPDRAAVGNDASWGEYLIDAIRREIGKVPDVTYEGIEAVRASWYDTLHIDVVTFDKRDYEISATELREAILRDDKDYYYQWCASGMEENYEYIREVLIECENTK